MLYLSPSAGGYKKKKKKLQLFDASRRGKKGLEFLAIKMKGHTVLYNPVGEEGKSLLVKPTCNGVTLDPSYA